LGTTLLIASSGFDVLLLAGLSWRIIVGLLVVSLGSLPVLCVMLHDYQRRRIMTLFAVFSEEFGLVGNTALLLLYMVVIGRGMMITANASTQFTRLVAGSITLTFFTYIFVNIGMVVGILPVVGVPLPLISYGGTSMVTMLLGFGILMSIETHPKLVKT
jgi:rod shape determining protein RodA